MYDRVQAVGEPEGDASRARDTLGRRSARAPTVTAEDQRDRSHGTRGLAQSGVPAHAVGWISRHRRRESRSFSLVLTCPRVGADR
jgi:hypothetical protein